MWQALERKREGRKQLRVWRETERERKRYAPSHYTLCLWRTHFPPYLPVSSTSHAGYLHSTRHWAEHLKITFKVNPKSKLYIDVLNSPTTYYINCDLIDREKNLLNGKKSDLLAKSDIKGEPFENISYSALCVTALQPIM